MEQAQNETKPRGVVLSERDAGELLSAAGIPVVESRFVHSLAEAKAAAAELGYPVVLKGNGPDIPHKTELGLVELGLRDEAELERAHARIASKEVPQLTGMLVQRQIRSSRELFAGMKRDAQFGPCVVFGVGGIFTEIWKDVSVRVAPLLPHDTREMMDELRASALLGPVRNLPEVDREKLSRILIALGQLGLDRPDIEAIDLNPILTDGPNPVAVDALVVGKSP